MSAPHAALAPGGTGERLLGLQALRALAALLVTIAHASEEAKHYFGFQPIFDTDPFGKGVDLFFVLSGFIIFHASRRGLSTGDLSATRFITNRLIRVAPLYYIFTTLMVLVVYFLPSGVKEAIFDPAQVITSYLFIPYERYDGRIAPTLSLGWTLNYEVFFYALFSVCLFLRPKRAALLAMGAILLLAIVGVALPSGAPAALREWTDSIILEFAFGVLIGLGLERYGRIKGGSTLLAMLIAIGGLALLYYLNLPVKPLQIPRFLSAGVPAALVVAATVLVAPAAVESKLPRWIVALGDSSYSLYLSHRFIQRPLQIAFSRGGVADLSFVGGAYVTCAVLAALALGHVVYLALEKPLLARLRKLASRSGTGREIAFGGTQVQRP